MVNSSKKYKSIMASARLLFWRYGFKRVTIEEICTNAQASKMTFYKFFDNKQELAKAVFDAEVAVSLAKTKAILLAETTTEEKMKQLILLKADGTHEISREFVEDFYTNPDLGMKTYIEQRTQEVWQEMIKDFKEAQQRGVFRKDMKMEFLLVFAQHITGLLTNPAAMQLFQTPQELILEVTRLMVYGLIPRNT